MEHPLHEDPGCEEVTVLLGRMAGLPLKSCAGFWLITPAGIFGKGAAKGRGRCRWTRPSCSLLNSLASFSNWTRRWRLTKLDPRQGKIVELRFFGGLTVEQATDVLGISPKTVKRDWSLAKAWLHGELKASHDGSTGELGGN
jgi:ECF sigma factor